MTNWIFEINFICLLEYYYLKKISQHIFYSNISKPFYSLNISKISPLFTTIKTIKTNFDLYLKKKVYCTTSFHKKI